MTTMLLTPYLNFDGTCRAAFETYADVLGGTIEMMMSHGDSPIAGQVPADWSDRIMHARLTAGDVMLMASDVPPGHYQKPQGLFVSLMVQTPEEADRIYGALSEGGRVMQPIQSTFWSRRFAMFEDRFGTPWMITTEQTPD